MNKNNKSNISISVDTYSSIDSAIVNKDIADKFSFSMYSLSSKKDNFDIFIRGLESLYTLTISRFYLAADDDSLVVEDADSNFRLFAVSSTANSVYDDISLYAKDPKTCEKIFNMLKPHLDKTSLELAIDMHEYFIDEAGKVSKSSSILNYSDLESFSSEFYPLYIWSTESRLPYFNHYPDGYLQLQCITENREDGDYQTAIRLYLYR